MTRIASEIDRRRVAIFENSSTTFCFLQNRRKMVSKPAYLPIIKDVAIFAASQVAFYLAFKAIMAGMDPQSSKRKAAKSKSSEVLGKLGLNLKELDLNEHEEIIAGEVVHSDDINVLFKGASAGVIASARVIASCHSSNRGQGGNTG